MSSVFESRDFKFYKKNFDSLAKIPFVRQLLKENEKLKKENAELKHTMFKLCKKMLEREETETSVHDYEKEHDSCCEVVLEKEEKENIVYEIEDDEDIEDEINKIKVKTECVEEEEEVVVEEEEVVVEEEEEEEEEVVVEEEEEAEEEVVVEEEGEEEEEEEEVVVEEEDEEAEVYEITIQSKTYYVTNEKDSIIYEADASGDISIEAGIYKNGKPTFYKK
jgi:hypothetical protein